MPRRNSPQQSFKAFYDMKCKEFKDRIEEKQEEITKWKKELAEFEKEFGGKFKRMAS